jgi:ubiquinone/menaquinone biosynthesis C-methylase UbiE
MNTNNFSDTLVEEYDLFGKVFPFHDELQQAIPESLKNHFAESANGGASLTFLDIGAGYGFTTKLVAKEFPKAKFILNEFDEELLSRADVYLESYNYEKKVGDIEEIIKTIPDQSIDAIYTAWVIHNFPPEKRAKLFSEIGRIIKPKGVFVALEKVGNTGEQRTKDLSQAIVDLYPFVTKHKRPDLFIEWVKHDLRDEESDLVFTDDENEKLLTENGFDWKYAKHILLEKVVVAVKK